MPRIDAERRTTARPLDVARRATSGTPSSAPSSAASGAASGARSPRVAERAAAALPTRLATATTAADARLRAHADPLAAQLRARADRALTVGATGAPVALSDRAATRTGGTTGVQAVGQVGDEQQEALALERELSETRQALGEAQLALENRNVLQKGWDWVTGGDDEAEENVQALKDQVAALEAKEAELDPDAVERARFTVFNERLAELEAEKGKGEAARLARQTYYNSDVWNGAAGTERASEAEINAAGFPRGTEYNDSAAVGGYSGEMRDPDGNRVDMGHVACALDWAVNKDRLSGMYGNPFDANAVTISGDVASAFTRAPVGGSDPAQAGRDAVAAEGDADWNGDIDGQNLAHRLESDPNASLADVVGAYYRDGAYQRRIDEWATHSKYIQRDENGVPRTDASGHYLLARDALQSDAHNFANVLTQGRALWPGVDYEEDAVLDAFGAWLDAAQAAQPASN